LDGLAATRIIHEELPGSRVIIVTQNDPALVRVQSKQVGASAWVAKHRLDSDLVPCIEKSSDGYSGNTRIDALEQGPARPADSVRANEWFSGNSEMACRIRDFDWSKTSLGSIEQWPQSLRTTVSLCLASNFPINIVWGPEHIQIYNDGYSVCCGDAHPRALGENYRVTWASAWPVIGDSFDRALAGETMYLENQRMFLNRLGGLPEETFFTFSHSPIRDESGGIGGLFHPVTETTGTMLAERRARALGDLSSNLGFAESEVEVTRKTIEVLSRYSFDLPFACYYRLEPDTGNYHLSGHFGIEPGRATPIVIAPDAATPWPFLEALRTGKIANVHDVRALLQGEACGPYPEPPNRAFVVPIVVPAAERPPAVVLMGASSRLPMNDTYHGFFPLVGVTISNALSTVRAREDDRRRAEALAEIDRAKTLFFSNVSHEFRTPLTLMLGPLQDLLSRSETHLSSMAKEQLELVNRNGARLLRLVNTLLDFSRIEAGRAQAVYVATDLAAVTAELASTFRSATERAGLRLSVDCREIGEPVYVDNDLWEKLVLNLLSNAFKFTLEGEIAVSLERAGSDVELRVRDTGVGIPAEEMPKLFERFHRISNARSRTFEGSGIGLALVQELVKLHGGSIHAESAVDRGTTFIVRVPLGQNHLPTGQVGGPRNLSSTAVGAAPFVEEALRWLPEEPAAEKGVPIDREPLTVNTRHAGEEHADRMRVLVADDNADMRQYLVRLLQSEYEVESVPDGQAAISAIQRKTPDLVLSDVMMPVMDGFELLKALRADERTQTIPIILLSARAGEESRIEGIEKGADDYLVKPFSARELVARVQTHLELARVRREADQALRENEERLRIEVCNRTRDLEARNEEILAQTDQLRQLSARVLHSQEEERKRIARELHDSAGQTLAALGIEQGRMAKLLADMPEAAKHLQESRNLTAQLTREIRTTSYLLHPPMLEEGGLALTLRSYLDGLAARGPIEVDLQVPEDFGRLPEPAELTIFRTVQEALTNIHRHSASKDAVIRLRRDSSKVSLEIEDHGTGMSAEKLACVQTHGGGVGIRGMRERLRPLHGELTIESSPAGTTLSVQIPLENAESASELARLAESVKIGAQSTGIN
ncbi:MAG: ATP-binding protein, partial [Candidatus Acidiferrales bacterium]